MTQEGKPILPPRAANNSGTGRAYGPHDPATAPDAVTVGRPGRWPSPQEEVRPLHPALVLQRATINRLAHERTRP